MPLLSGPDVGAVELEVIVFTSPTPAVAGQARFGGTLRVAWTGPVIRLDPVTNNFFTGASEYHSAVVGAHLFESLFRWNNEGSVEPSLVDTWSLSADGLTYTFKLREGVRFHDGSPVTSEDVRLSLDRWKSTGSPQASIVRKFTLSRWLNPLDDTTITVTLQRPLPGFIDLIGQPYLTPYVMPTSQAIRQPRRNVNELIGTGPYAMVGWRPGEAVTVERYRNYAARTEPTSGYAGEQIAWIDRITWVDVNDPALQIAALLTGQVDVVDGADLSAFGRLSDEPSVQVLLGRPGNRAVVYLNPATAPFQDRRARLAAQAAIDVEAAMGAMGDPDLWSLCPAIYWCGTPLDVRDGGELYGGGDVDRARALLADSGYDGETIILLGPLDHAWTGPLITPVAASLRAAGFSVEEAATDYLTFGGLTRSVANYDAVLGWYGYWAGGSPITDPTLTNSNRYVVDDDDLNELRNRYVLEADLAARLDIVREINRLRLEKATVVLLGTFDHMLPITRDLKGVDLFAFPYFGNAWLER